MTSVPYKHPLGPGSSKARLDVTKWYVNPLRVWKKPCLESEQAVLTHTHRPRVHLLPMAGICAADTKWADPVRQTIWKSASQQPLIPFFTETLQHTEKPPLLSEGRIRILQKHETHICDSWLTSKIIKLFKTYKIGNFLNCQTYRTQVWLLRMRYSTTDCVV